MANYHTKFGCVLPLGTAENVAQALQLYFEFDLEKSTEGKTLGFNVCSTNKMPASATWSDPRGRPPSSFSRSGGSSGFTTAQRF